MKRWIAAVLLGLVLSTSVASAGMFCEEAAFYDWKSPALNFHCALEYLWELMI